MKKTNNKGFSLIELIIVIAIMAVLVAIIAPNLTKYLGKSKKNTDKKNLDEIESTLKTCITDYDMEYDELLADGGTLTVTFGASGATLSTDNANFKSIVDTAIDASKTKSKDKNNKYAIATITKSSGTYGIKVEFQS